MPATKKTENKKTVKKDSKTVKTKQPKKTELKSSDFSEKFNNAVSNLRFNAATNFSHFSKKAWLVVALIGIILLLVTAGKYLVIAWVDGKPVTRFEEYQTLEQRYGKDIREQLIVEKLILSEAAKRGIKVSDQDINNEIKKIEGEQGGKESLNQILTSQGISQEEFRKLVRLQILRQKMFGGNVTVAEEEIDKYIQDNNQLTAQSEDASATAKLREDVRQQLLAQKVNTAFSDWLKQNLQSSRVIRY